MLRRYRSSYNKRRSKAQYFPSSMRSFRYPSYYQRIGRTIQTTAGRLPNSPYKILSQPELERMYRTLVQYKYPIPREPGPPAIQPFMVINRLYFSTLFNSSNNYTFDPTQLKQEMDLYLAQNYTLLFQNHDNWRYQIIYLSVENVSPSPTVGYLFQIQLNHGLFQTNPYGLIMKTVSTEIAGNNISPTITIQPYTIEQLRAYRLTLTNSGTWQQTSNNINSNDPDPSDQGLYPIMDSSTQPGELYYSTMEYVQEGGNTPVNLRLILHIVCIPIEDF